MFKKIINLKKPNTILAILLVISLSLFAYYFIQYKKLTKDPAEEARVKTAEVVEKISKLMVLTDKTNAVLATITDKTKLAGQPFFAVAENGDDLVLFPNMSKAVLYRPSIDKIIDVGPFNPNPEKASSNTTTKPAQKATSTSTTASSTKTK